MASVQPDFTCNTKITEYKQYSVTKTSSSSPLRIHQSQIVYAYCVKQTDESKALEHAFIVYLERGVPKLLIQECIGNHHKNIIAVDLNKALKLSAAIRPTHIPKPRAICFTTTQPPQETTQASPSFFKQSKTDLAQQREQCFAHNLKAKIDLNRQIEVIETEIAALTSEVGELKNILTFITNEIATINTLLTQLPSIDQKIQLLMKGIGTIEYGFCDNIENAYTEILAVNEATTITLNELKEILKLTQNKKEEVSARLAGKNQERNSLEQQLSCVKEQEQMFLKQLEATTKL